MYTFLGFLCLFSLITTVYFGIRYFVGRKKNIHRARRHALYAWISVAILFLSGWGINQTPEGKQDAKDEARESSIQKVKDAQKASAKKASSIKAVSIKQAKSASESSAKKASVAAKASSESHAEALKKAASSKKAAKEKAKYSSYKSVTSVFPKGVQNYSDSQLLKGGNVKIDTKVIDIGADGLHQYHLLFKEGDSLMLFVVDSKKTGKVVLGDRIVVYGMINGTGKINNNQTNVGLSDKYADQKVGLIMADKVINKH